MSSIQIDSIIDIAKKTEIRVETKTISWGIRFNISVAMG